MAKQKQRKQLILTDNNNISTYRLLPTYNAYNANFMTDGLRKSMHIKDNGDKTQNILFHIATTTFKTQFYEW